LTKRKNSWTTTSLELPKQQAGIEEVLMKKSAVLAVLEKPGCSKRRKNQFFFHSNTIFFFQTCLMRMCAREEPF